VSERVKAVLFDLDGTLVDSMRLIHKALNVAFRKNGFKPMTLQELARVAGTPLAGLLKRTDANVSDEVVEAVKRDFLATYASISEGRTRLLPGVKPTVKWLHSRGYKLGIVTTTPRMVVDRDLNRFGLAGYMSVVLTADEVKNPKPAPDSLIMAVRMLNVAEADALYVGDSPVDIRAAKACGVRAVAVETGLCDAETLQEEKPDVILPDIRYLPNFLLSQKAAFQPWK